MSDFCQDLQKAYANILQDLMSMSADVIKKSDILLKETQSPDLISPETVSNNIEKLLNRVTTNIASFTNTFSTATETYKAYKLKLEVSPKRKSKLSLRRNGTTQETDVDLTNSDDEVCNSPKKSRDADPTRGEETDGSVSDTDSEKTVRYFDVPVPNGVSGEIGNNDDLVKALDELDKISDKADLLKQSNDTMSFDFDDVDDDLVAEMDKYERKVKEEASREQAQRDNDELLELLKQAVDSSQGIEMNVEEEAELALRILEEDVSSATDTDSDESEYSRSSAMGVETEDEDDFSEVEEKDPEYELKTLSIDMKQRVDEMDDAEIDRLCNIHSLNKRKCIRALKKVKKRKRCKRIRLISSSSSSSTSSDLSSWGSTTPDLIIDTQRPQTPNDTADVTALADELVDKLDKEDDVDISSLDSDTDIDDDNDSSKEEEKTKVEVKSEKKEAEKPEKNNDSLRYDIKLWTSDEDSNSDFEVITDLVEKTEVVSDITTIISDTESSDSDEVTFIDEVQSDAGSSKGRRNIRAILSDDELNVLTQQAKSEEDARIRRLEHHCRTIESIQSQHEEAFILDVEVNTGQALITVHDTLAQMLKPHQKAGVQFMWEACYESVEMLKKKAGTGCILAHCMGLGKTLQVITLVHTLFTHPVTNTKHVLVICPLSTVINWKNEIRNTFSKLSEYPKLCYEFLVKTDVQQKVTAIRAWRHQGGILVMGYECFQILTNEKTLNKLSPGEKQVITEGLLNPGPDLVVCDEGHQLKNGKTLKTKAVMKVKTKRRIVLTGTPLQNNLEEYYWMVHFVKPHLLGTLPEYNNRFTTPIKNGQYQDSRPEDIKLMKKRTHVLTKLLKKTVHRVESSVLSMYLPQIKDYTVFMKLTELQVKLYRKYIDLARTKISRALYFHDCMVLGLNNLHPYALQIYYWKPKSKPKKKRKLEEDEHEQDDIPDGEGRDCHDWYKDIFPADVTTNINYSTKLKLIIDILEETIRLGQKTLLFVKYLAELDLLEHFFNQRSWNYLRMDGRTPAEDRDKLCKRFNSNPMVHMFLLTHKVGGLGLNLTGANRVIMIGSNHNPSHDTQSMYRVYRFGQTKECYVYRLLSLGTMEEKIYNKCVVKLHLSGTVVDKLHFGRPFSNDDLQGMYRDEFDSYEGERPIPVVPTDELLALLLHHTTNIYRYHLHNSLLENRPEEELTDEDKKLAWEEFNHLQEAAKQVVHPPAYPVIPAQLINYSRFGQWNNTSSMVPNPMNNSARGFIPRGLLQNQNQNGTSFNNPQNTGQNPFLNLLQPGRPTTSGYNRRIDNQVVQTVRDIINRFEISRQNIPAAERLRNFENAASREVPEAPPNGGEFNYALNKVV